MPFIIQDGGGGSSSGGEQTIIRTQNMRMTQLWQNASPSSQFVAQTIPVDLSGYSMVYIRYLVSTGNTIQEQTIWGHVGTTLLIPFVSHKSANYGGRQCQIDEQGLSFGDSFNHSNTAQQQYMIPIAIYGVKAQVLTDPSISTD